MDYKGIERFSYVYAFLKILLYPAFRYFYRVEIVKDFDEKKNKAYIFSPNHHNALMDSLLIVFSRWEQIVPLGRADMFKSSFAAFFLKVIKIMPIYRIRDGYGSLKKNEDVFDKTIDILRTSRALLIYPEANHAQHRSLRVLKKGLARIAFQAQEELGEEREVEIVPIGLYYRHYFFVRSEALIHYGKPFSVKPFVLLYKKDKAKALNALNAELAKRMKELFPHIPYRDKKYEAVLQLADIWISNTNTTKTSEKVQLLQKATQEMLNLEIENPEEFKKRIDKLTIYRAKLKTTRVNDETVYRYNSSCLFCRCVLLVIGFPLFVVGLIPNYLPYKLPLLVSRNAKDMTFQATFHFGFSVVILFPVFYLGYLSSLLFWIDWYWAIGFIGLGLGFGAFSYSFFRFWKRTQRFIRLTKKKEFREILSKERKCFD